MLTKSDLQNIQSIVRSEVKQEVAEQLDAKLTEKLAFLPTKDEFYEQMSKVLKAVEDKENKGLAHDDLHTNLGKDTTKLKQQVQHLFKTFEIVDPTEVAISI